MCLAPLDKDSKTPEVLFLHQRFKAIKLQTYTTTGGPGLLRHKWSRVFCEILDDAPSADETAGAC